MKLQPKKYKMKNTEKNIKVIIGTPNSDGYSWNYTHYLMSEDEYKENKKNLQGSSCSIMIEK
jgi:hypothetical protein